MLSCHLLLAGIVQSFLSSHRYYYTYSAFVSSGLDHYNAPCRMLLAAAIWKMKLDQNTAAHLFSSISYCKYLTHLPYHLSQIFICGCGRRCCFKSIQCCACTHKTMLKGHEAAKWSTPGKHWYESRLKSLFQRLCKKSLDSVNYMKKEYSHLLC